MRGLVIGLYRRHFHQPASRQQPRQCSNAGTHAWGKCRRFWRHQQHGRQNGQQLRRAQPAPDWQAPQFNEGFDALPQARPTDTGHFASDSGGQAASAESGADADLPADYPMGAARAQLHQNYIIAETAEGMSLSISTPPMKGWCLRK